LTSDKEGVVKKSVLFLGAMLLAAASVALQPTLREGLVEFYGRQADIVRLGETEGRVPVARMSGEFAQYGLGAVEGLDGEITVFEGRAYVTRMRDGQMVMDDGDDTSAIFAAWTLHSSWTDVSVPDEVVTYVELQQFIGEQAGSMGVDTASEAFPFLMHGAPASIKWHINLDRTDGQTVTRELFEQSKDYFTMEGKMVDIIGFYSEQHHGVFIGTFAPALAGSGVQNALHMHLVSADRSQAGHIDDLLLGGGMTLRLPAAAE